MSKWKEGLEEMIAIAPKTPEDEARLEEAKTLLVELLQLERRREQLEGQARRLFRDPGLEWEMWALANGFYTGQAAPEDSGPGPDPDSPSLAGLSLHEAARRVLEEEGRRMHVQELGARIKARGWRH